MTAVLAAIATATESGRKFLTAGRKMPGCSRRPRRSGGWRSAIPRASREPRGASIPSRIWIPLNPTTKIVMASPMTIFWLPCAAKSALPFLV
jgi:hypothetical protein